MTANIAFSFLVLILAPSVSSGFVETLNTRKPVDRSTPLPWKAQLVTAAFDDAENENSDAATTTPEPKKGSRRSLNDVTIMSQAIPFLKAPSVLAECGDELAGNMGFDPLNLAKNREQLFDYREAEIKHARLAMLAAAGWPISELFDRKIAGFIGVAAALDATDRVPSVLNGGLERISPTFWGFCLGLSAAIDLYGVQKSREGNPKYIPGQLGFDPLGLYPADKEGQQRMQLAEIKHGRVSMLAVTGYAIQEYVTHMGVIDETPFFFVPISISNTL